MTALLPPSLYPTEFEDSEHYLNLAYMAPLHPEVVSAGRSSLDRQARPLELGVDAMFGEVDRLRNAFAKLVGATANRVAIMPAVSYGLSTVAKNIELGAGDRVVVVAEQFPSNVYPWQRACADSGAELITVAPPQTLVDRGRLWNQRLLEAIDHETRLVSVPNTHWSDGTLFDLAALRARTREVDCALVVDGTQSVGVVPINAEELELDALICAGYKTLLGPYGTSYGYFGPRFDSGTPIEETWHGRVRSDDFANLVDYQTSYRDGAGRYEAGQRCNFITMPMCLRALELIAEWTPSAISSTCAALTAGLDERLAEAGFWVEHAQHRSPQLLGIRPPQGMAPQVFMSALQERHIAVSLRGQSFRVSTHIYNTSADIDALVEALIAQT